MRWPLGVRLHHLFERRCDRFAGVEDERQPAVIEASGVVTFAELDARANRLARFLVRSGVRPGDRVALLMAGSAEAYAAMLAVMKAGAAYVPLDAGFPDAGAQPTHVAGIRNRGH